MVLNHHVLTRQKSFQDQDMAIMSSSIFITKGKFLKSPSPSSRFESSFSKSQSPSRRFSIAAADLTATDQRLRFIE